MPVESRETLSSVKYVVQYRRKETDDWHGYDPWHTMAAFDVEGAAQQYCFRQDRTVWEYRWCELAPADAD